ncbi:NADH-quinone oxidoreductase, L subunit domain protein [Mycobacterium xenopi 3993]|nr:NADH-quinone oxidoreductase, L subunit domain protein [Mycobacterium xenopi 3993]
MSRVMLMTFFGEKRWAPDAHPHEAPAVMTWPMILLAVGSVFSGGLLATGGALQHWLEPVVGVEAVAQITPVWMITVLVLVLVGAGIAVAVGMFGLRSVPQVAPRVRRSR